LRVKKIVGGGRILGDGGIVNSKKQNTNERDFIAAKNVAFHLTPISVIKYLSTVQKIRRIHPKVKFRSYDLQFVFSDSQNRKMDPTCINLKLRVRMN
jgi:hypothetical protein